MHHQEPISRIQRPSRRRGLKVHPDQHSPHGKQAHTPVYPPNQAPTPDHHPPRRELTDVELRADIFISDDDHAEVHLDSCFADQRDIVIGRHTVLEQVSQKIAQTGVVTFAMAGSTGLLAAVVFLTRLDWLLPLALKAISLQARVERVSTFW